MNQNLPFSHPKETKETNLPPKKPSQRSKTLAQGAYKRNRRLKPPCLSFLEGKVVLFKTPLPTAEMFHVIIIQEDKDSRILGITKATFKLSPDVQWKLHFRKWLFLLNTLKWSKGKELNLIIKRKLSGIYSGSYFRSTKLVAPPPCVRPEAERYKYVSGSLKSNGGKRHTHK